MCHLPEEEFENLEIKLNDYGIGGYVIAHESEPFSHFHFLVEMTEQSYRNFRKSCFIDKYKLKGKAGDGIPRQYGRVSNIDDFDKMLSYTCKDENIRSNLDDETINDAIDKSFKKQGPKLLKEKMVRYIDGLLTEKSYTELVRYKDKKSIIKLILEWLINEKIPIRKSIVETYYTYWRQFTTHTKNVFTPEDYIKDLYGQQLDY